MNYTDEELNAYADGELRPERSRELSAAAKQAPALARRIHGRAASRRALHEAFAGTLKERIPAALIRAARGASRPQAGGARWTDWLSTLFPQPAWAPAALAASLALVVGLTLGPRGFSPSPMAAGLLVADAKRLSAALQEQPSGTVAHTANGGEIVPLSSFVATDGRYCRSFTSSVPDQPSTRGVGCRGEHGAWTVELLARIHPAPPEAAPGHLPAAGETMDAADLFGVQRRLTPLEERELLSRSWAPAPVTPLPY